MNKLELRDLENKRHSLVIETIASLPSFLNATSVSTNGIFVADATYAKNLITLKKLREAGWRLELTHYSAYGEDRLCSVHEGEDCPRVLMYHIDGETALAALSKNKCRFTSETKTSTTVVCPL